ncbi:MAG: carbohydrate kinase [Akkermansiaceae bacterium]|nr:carbohydrate kinase [Akkermansiaceae bacterium]MCF7730055.1 carbohydrate kinase [Akkermansiaceae bacterium]
MKPSSNPQPLVISLGEVLWDLFPAGPSFGGAPANFACHAVSLGARVSIVSAVGQDAYGRQAREILTSLGVDTALLQDVANLPTGAVAVSLDSAGKPVFAITKGAAWDNIAWSDSLAASIPTANMLYFGTLAQREAVTRGTIRRALAVAVEAGVPRVLDVNLRPPFFDHTMIRESVNLCSILKLSDDELPTVTAACEIQTMAGVEASLRALLERYDLAVIALTRGANGTLLLSRHEMIDQPGIPTKVCDTVGAGDSFTAALVTGLLAGKPLADIARHACQTAAFVCSQPGAVPQSSSNIMASGRENPPIGSVSDP